LQNKELDRMEKFYNKEKVQIFENDTSNSSKKVKIKSNKTSSKSQNKDNENEF